MGDPLQWRSMASTLWLVSLVMGYQRFIKLRSGITNKCFCSNILSKDVPDVYTRVSYFLPWINATILSNGGLASCDYSLTALPVQGNNKPGSRYSQENWNKNRSLCKIKFTRKWWTVSWKALGINSDRWMGRQCNFLNRNVWL